MRRLYTAMLCGILCAYTAQAQNQQIPTARNPLTAGKTTELRSRLSGDITLSYFNGQYEVSDTSWYKYNTEERGRFSNNEWDFDTSMHYINDGLQLVEYQYSVKEYNTANRMITSILYTDDGFGFYMNSRNRYTYDASGNILTMESEYDNSGTLEKISKYIYTYNSKNQQTSYVSQGWTGGTWQDASRSTTTYNTKDKPEITQYEELKSGIWVPTTKITNTYQDTLLMQTLGENPTGPVYRTTYTYTGTNPTTILYDRYDGSTWIPESRTNSTYDAMGNVLTSQYAYWDGTAFVISSGETFTYDSHNNVLTEISENAPFLGGPLKPYSMTTKTYNSFDQLVTSDRLSWNEITMKYEPDNGDRNEHYYYQQVNTSVKSAGIRPGNMTVYPVPAHNNIVVSASFNKPAAFTVGIYDAKGMLVKSWKENATTEYNRSIDITELPAGNYVINIHTNSGQLATPVVIAR